MPRPKGKTLTPQDILDVAIILLETQGVEDFSINQLAKALAILRCTTTLLGMKIFVDRSA
jgi:AcrR family transcriptional regulator